jgi:glycine reductase
VITKELERAGIPTVQVCNMTPVAESVGVSRICPSQSIKYPLGNPDLSKEDEILDRVKKTETALQYLTP